MRIVHDELEGEEFLEIWISREEHDMIKDYMIVSKKHYLLGQEISIGISLNLEHENENN